MLMSVCEDNISKLSVIIQLVFFFFSGGRGKCCMLFLMIAIFLLLAVLLGYFLGVPLSDVDNNSNASDPIYDSSFYDDWGVDTP